MERGIDYKLLVRAQDYYTLSGYQYIDLPWTVDEDISNITKPAEAKNFHVNKGVLVASGEQSFLQLSFKGGLKPGKYQGITGCVRDEDVLDRYHQECFIKLELFQSDNVCEENLIKIFEDAKKFFKQYCGSIEVEPTSEGVDITTKDGIELGSYGIRHYNGFSWLFGTGVALPRLTRAILR